MSCVKSILTPFFIASIIPTSPNPPQWWTDVFKFQFPHLQNGNNEICFKNMKAYERGKWVLCPPRPLPSKCRVPNCDFKTLGIPASLPVLSSAHSDQHKGMYGRRKPLYKTGKSSLLQTTLVSQIRLLFPRIQRDTLNSKILQMHQKLKPVVN